MKENELIKILNKIYTCLIAIIVLLFIMIISSQFTNTNSTNNTNNNQTEEDNAEYDTSMMDEITTTEAIAKINNGGKHLVYIGRATCGYCVKFAPILAQAQKDYGYKTIYIDITQMSEDDQKALLELDNEDKYISENFGGTPMVLVFEDGKFKNGHMGYAEYSNFAKFLEDNGYKK